MKNKVKKHVPTESLFARILQGILQIPHKILLKWGEAVEVVGVPKLHVRFNVILLIEINICMILCSKIATCAYAYTYDIYVGLFHL